MQRAARLLPDTNDDPADVGGVPASSPGTLNTARGPRLRTTHAGSARPTVNEPDGDRGTMRGAVRRVVPAVAAAIILAGFGSSGVAAQEPDAEAEVRITARRLADGRTEFALQERAAGGSWGERRLPRLRFVPASPAVGRWLSSSVLTIDFPVLAMLSAEEDASVELRIAARRLADGRTEVALQERSPGGSWSVRRLPRSRFIPARPVVGRWLPSSSITAPSALPDDLPGVSDVEVLPRQNGIEIAFVGAQVGASSWWWPPTPEEYVPQAMAGIVEFF